MLRFSIFVLIILTTYSHAEIKEKIIKNLKETKNLDFNFEQNINDKIEKGKCILEYPKKIFCEYDLGNKKILVSNGSSFVIKTLSSYYIYPLKKTFLRSYVFTKCFRVSTSSNFPSPMILNLIFCK